MEKKQICSHTQKKKKKSKNRDNCPVCDENLYYDNHITQRVGLLADDDYTIEGWMCPHCTSRFDLKNNLVYINPTNISVGRA